MAEHLLVILGLMAGNLFAREFARLRGSKLYRVTTHLLAAGVNVSRTPAKLVRYHNKMLIVDGRLLFVLSFNFTHLDIDHSRGFGIVTRRTKLVQEALKLFEADSQRKTYTSGLDTFVVSPANARTQLAAQRLLQRLHRGDQRAKFAVAARPRTRDVGRVAVMVGPGIDQERAHLAGHFAALVLVVHDRAVLVQGDDVAVIGLHAVHGEQRCAGRRCQG